MNAPRRLELPGRPVVFLPIPGQEGWWLADVPLTQGQWRALGEGEPPGVFRGDDLPVEDVDWFTAQAVCERLGQRLGAQGTLPTTAVWVHACCAGGPLAAPAPLGDYAWYRDTSGGRTNPVARLKPNAWGFYDILGNVWEWCRDAKPGDPAKKSVRGGSWSIPPEQCGPGFIGGDPPAARGHNLGFRPALHDGGLPG